jgi:hypothetical protein
MLNLNHMNNTQKKNEGLDGLTFIYKEKLESRYLISKIIHLFQSLMSQAIQKIIRIFHLIKLKMLKEILRIINLNNNC